MACVSAAREQKKAATAGQISERQWRHKIGGVMRRHADKLRKAVQELEDAYGWRLERMVRDAKHALLTDCPYCFEPYKDWTDVSLDIVDGSASPYYMTNTRWVCVGCNRKKQRTPPPVWAAICAAFERSKRLKKRPTQRGLIFD